MDLTPSEPTYWLSRRGAIVIEHGEWPILSCVMMRVPHDRELISFLEQREKALKSRVRHAVLIQLPTEYVEPLEHGLLRDAWSRVNAGKLVRYCAGVAFVRPDDAKTRMSIAATFGELVPSRAFEAVPPARAWLRARLQQAPV